MIHQEHFLVFVLLSVEFVPRKTNLAMREANEEAKDRRLGILNNIKSREAYSILNPLIIDGKNVVFSIEL